MPLSGILGGFETPLEATFSYFFSQGKNKISGKIGDFFPIFFFRFFPVQIFSKPPENRFFDDKSAEKSNFLAINRPKNPIFCSPVILYHLL